MIYITSETHIPSVNETLGILRRHNEMLPQLLDFDKVQMYLNKCLLESGKIKGPLFECLKISSLSNITPADALKRLLTENGYAGYFKRTKTGISLEKGSIDQALSTGKMDKDTVAIIQAYQRYSNMNKSARTLMGLLQLPICDAVSYDNHRMLMVTPTWAPQNTGRVAMKDPAIQNFPREFQDLLTVPKGWTILHTDSGQIEPRVIYSAFIRDPQIQALINLYDDAYFGVLHYVTMPEQLIASGTTNFEKMQLTDEQKEMRKEIKTYQNAVMYGSTSNDKASPIKDALIRRIGQHHMRQAWLASNNRELAKGVTVFKSAFGTPIDISLSQKLNGLDGGEADYEFVKLAINNPIQATAADLMRVSVDEANFLLGKKATKSYIVNYVHDAGTFAIHDDDYDKVADELADIVSYHVDGWLPIKAEPEFGRVKGWFEDYY